MLLTRRTLAVDEADAEARWMFGEAFVERFPLERVDQLGVAPGHNPELRLRDEVPHDAEKLVASPTNADVAFAMHAEQTAGRAEHQVADLVTVCVVVVLESVVIDHLDAEAVAAMLFAQGREQPLFAKLAPVEQGAPVAAHPAQQRLALFELDPLLAKLFEHVEEHLVPVFDLVADREVERVEARLDEIELRRRQLEHAADVVEEVAHRAGQLPFGRDDLGGQWVLRYEGA